MNLADIANYFGRTPVDGWDGSTWLPALIRGTLLPFDRFVSEREFGIKRRYFLVHPDSPLPEYVKVVRFPSGPTYLVGEVNRDVQEDTYGLVYLLHRVSEEANILENVKVKAASGVVTSLHPVVVRSYHCDVERVTFVRSKQYDELRYQDSVVILPSGADVGLDNEIDVGGLRFAVEEVYDQSGFRYCRALTRKP